MGLLKAAAGAAGGVLADQWKEYFYCEAMDADTLVAKGEKRTSKRSSNKKGEENIISNGSVIAVNEGQCMMIVEQGKVVEMCAEPGEFVYDTSSEPTVFEGELGESVREMFYQMGSRFLMGGDTGKDQRIYFVNTKEITGNKYGTPAPVPFRVVDNNIGLDVDISIRCNGEYSYKIVNPILFYTNVCGNVASVYEREEIGGMLKTELLTALQPAFARLSEQGIRYSALPGHTLEITDALNEILSKKWTELRGIEIVSFGMNSVTAPKEDEEMIKQLQKSAVMRDPTMAAASLVGAQGDAMRAAAANANGAMAGFMGMGMAQNAGGMNAQNLYAMGQQAAQARQEQQVAQARQEQMQQAWTCSCGMVNEGKFCSGCGQKKPVSGWTCSCGAVNQGKFCQECGQKKPAGVPLYRCDKCGWEPEDPKNPPRFCPECGDPFTEDDIR